MSDNAKKFLESIGWDYINTETAARVVADEAQKRIDELEAVIAKALERAEKVGAVYLPHLKSLINEAAAEKPDE